jgi:fructose-1,6-bisphosphatase/inositol monophosphatase family enzyme
MPAPTSPFERWRARLVALCDELREVTRAALAAAERDATGAAGAALARPHGQGAGDVTFGLDVPSERHIEEWLERAAREEPLSLLTEDSGWRHLGPDGRGGARALDGFDHGGPRVAIDPIDGTRNLMADLRSAWTLVSFAPAGPGEPRLSDLVGGFLAEIPPSNAATYRVLTASAGSCELAEHDLAGGTRLRARRLRVDPTARVERGYFPFFRYEPAHRPALARLERAFFERLARHEGTDPRAVYDDQYISSAGQLALLALGTYRMVVDARALVARRAGVSAVTSKPYDVAGAILCARAAGAVVTAADGSELDFPLDATTPVDFVGYANAATRERLEPHWLAVLAEA